MLIILFWWIGCVSILCKNVNCAPYTVFNHYSTVGGSKSSAPQVFVSYAHYPEDSVSNTGDPYLDNYYNSKNTRKYFRRILKNSFDGPELNENGQGIMNGFRYYNGERHRRPEHSNRIRYENLLRRQFNGYSSSDQDGRSEETESLLSLSKDMSIPECVHEKITRHPCVYMETGGKSEVAQVNLKPSKNNQLSEAVKLADHYPYSQLVQEGKHNNDNEFFLNSQPSIIVNNEKIEHKKDDCVKNVMKKLNTEIVGSTTKENQEKQYNNNFGEETKHEQSVFSGYNLKDVSSLLKLLNEHNSQTDKDQPSKMKLNLSAEKISNIILAINGKQLEDNVESDNQPGKVQPTVFDKIKPHDPRLSKVFTQFTPSLDIEKDKEREERISEVRKNLIKGKTQELIKEPVKDNNNAKEEFTEEVGISFNDWAQVNEVLRKLEEAKNTGMKEKEVQTEVLGKPKIIPESVKIQISKQDSNIEKVSLPDNKPATKNLNKDMEKDMKLTESKKLQIVNRKNDETGVDAVLEGNIETSFNSHFQEKVPILKADNKNNVENIEKPIPVESEGSKMDIILTMPVYEKPKFDSVSQPQLETSNGKSNIEHKLVGPLFKQKQNTLNSYFDTNVNLDRNFIVQSPLIPVENSNTEILANNKKIEKPLTQPLTQPLLTQVHIFPNTPVQPYLQPSENINEQQENVLIQPLLKQKEKTMAKLFNQPDLNQPELHEREGIETNDQTENVNNERMEHLLIQPFYKHRQQMIEQIIPQIKKDNESDNKNDPNVAIQQPLDVKRTELADPSIIQPTFNQNQNFVGKVISGSPKDRDIVIQENINNENIEQSLIQPLFIQKQKMVGVINESTKVSQDVVRQPNFNQNIQQLEVGQTILNNQNIQLEHIQQPIQQSENNINQANSENQQEITPILKETTVELNDNSKIQNSLMPPFFKQKQKTLNKFFENSAGPQPFLVGNDNLNIELVNRADQGKNVINENGRKLENQGENMNFEQTEAETFLKEVVKSGINLDELKRLLKPKINKVLIEKVKDSKSVSAQLEQAVLDGQKVLESYGKSNDKSIQDVTDVVVTLNKNIESDSDSYEDKFQEERLLDPDDPNLSIDQNEYLVRKPAKNHLVKEVPLGNVANIPSLEHKADVLKETIEIKELEKDLKLNENIKESFDILQAIEDTSSLDNGGEDLTLEDTDGVEIIPGDTFSAVMIPEEEELIDKEAKTSFEKTEKYIIDKDEKEDSIEYIYPKTRADIDDIGHVFPPDFEDSIELEPSVEDNSEPIELQPFGNEPNTVVKYEAFAVEGKLAADENTDKDIILDAVDVEDIPEPSALSPLNDKKTIDKDILLGKTDEQFSNIYLNSDKDITSNTRADIEEKQDKSRTQSEDSIEFIPSVEDSSELNSDEIFLTEPEFNIKELNVPIDLDTDDSIYDISPDSERTLESSKVLSEEYPISSEKIVRELTVSEESVENNKNPKYMESTRKLIELYHEGKIALEKENVNTDLEDKIVKAENMYKDERNSGKLKKVLTASEESVERNQNPEYMDDIKNKIKNFNERKNNLENNDFRELNEPAVPESSLEYTSPINEEIITMEKENVYSPESSYDESIEMEEKNPKVEPNNKNSGKLTASEESVENNKNPEYMENIHKMVKFYSLQKANMENENNKELNEPIFSTRNTESISPLIAELKPDTEFSGRTENFGEIDDLVLNTNEQASPGDETIRNRRDISFHKIPHNVDPELLSPRYKFFINPPQFSIDQKQEQSSGNRERREITSYYSPDIEISHPKLLVSFNNFLPNQRLSQHAGLSRQLRHVLNDHQATIAETRVLNYDPIIEYVNAHLQNYIERNNIVKGRFENEMDNRRYLKPTNFCKDCDVEVVESIKHILENPPEFLEHFDAR